MSDSPFVSVIVLNYNGQSFIKDCLDSVLASSYENFEIVVVDNASTDSSLSFLQENYRQNPKVRLFRSEKQLYFAGGSNLGSKKARGEKLIFLNSDTVVDKDWLKELVHFTQENENYLVQPKILCFNQKDVIDNVGGRYVFPGFGLGIGHGQKDCGQYENNAPLDYANGTCFLIDKKFFEELGGFDEWYQLHYEDVDLNRRAQKHGGQSWCCPKAVIWHKGSLTIKETTAKKSLLFSIYKNRLRTVLKNFHGPQRIIRFACLVMISLCLSPRTALKALKAVGLFEYRLGIEKIRLGELKSILKKEGFDLLDIGCGDGVFLNLAREKGITALGADPLPKTFYPGVINSSLENLNINQQFDAVTLFHVLEHTQNPLAALKKAISFLKKDGILVIETPLVGNLTEKFLGKNYFTYHDKTHLQFFKEKQVLDLCRQAGLVVKKQGFTFLEFPLTVITASFGKGYQKSFLGIILFLPLKILSRLGLNKEIIRLYCLKA